MLKSKFSMPQFLKNRKSAIWWFFRSRSKYFLMIRTKNLARHLIVRYREIQLYLESWFSILKVLPFGLLSRRLNRIFIFHKRIVGIVVGQFMNRLIFYGNQIFNLTGVWTFIVIIASWANLVVYLQCSRTLRSFYTRQNIDWIHRKKKLKIRRLLFKFSLILVYKSIGSPDKNCWMKAKKMDNSNKQKLKQWEDV